MLRLQELWLLRSSRHAPVNVKLGTSLHMCFPELGAAGREQDPEQEGEREGSILVLAGRWTRGPWSSAVTPVIVLCHIMVVHRELRGPEAADLRFQGRGWWCHKCSAGWL